MTAPAKLPAWKTVECPTCDAKPGESCGRRDLGVPWWWWRTAPHAARRRLAGGALAAAGGERLGI